MRHVPRPILAATGALLALACAAPNASATFPGRNGPIAFGADTGTGYQIYTVRPNGHDLRQLTHLAGDSVNADWSPDGTKIVFERDLGEDQGPPFCVIEMMNADGSGLVDLTGSEVNGCDSQPSFTPDGRSIVFVNYDPTIDVEAIWIMDVKGADRRFITRGTHTGVSDPNTSPDGRSVSFIRYSGEDLGQALSTTDLHGNGLFDVVPPSSDVAIKQDWAPDGGRLVFTDAADDFSRPANVATVRPNGTGLRYLTDFTTPEMRGYTGGYSPDGHWIVFRLEDHGRFALERISARGGPMHTLLPLSDLRPRFIDWGSR